MIQVQWYTACGSCPAWTQVLAQGHSADGGHWLLTLHVPPPTASRDPPMLSGQEIQLSEGSLFHMLELSDEECETRASRDTL